MFIVLKKIYTFNSIYTVCVVHTFIYRERERDPVHLFYLKFTLVCMFVFSNEQAAQNKVIQKSMNLFHSNNLGLGEKRTEVLA